MKKVKGLTAMVFVMILAFIGSSLWLMEVFNNLKKELLVRELLAKKSIDSYYINKIIMESAAITIENLIVTHADGGHLPDSHQLTAMVQKANPQLTITLEYIKPKPMVSGSNTWSNSMEIYSWLEDPVIKISYHHKGRLYTKILNSSQWIRRSSLLQVID
jgi:hypothetical protein